MVQVVSREHCGNLWFVKLSSPRRSPTKLSRSAWQTWAGPLHPCPQEAVRCIELLLVRNSWVVTGPLNKLVHLVFTRLLPRSLALQARV